MSSWPVDIFTSSFGKFWFGSLTILYGISVWAYNHNLIQVQLPKPTIRRWLVRWNVFISIVSGLGFWLVWRNFPGIGHVFRSDCISCEKAWVYDNWWDAHAGFLFMILKPVEFIDTIFLMLNNKPISKLHWIHHITVTLFCWHCAVYANVQTAGAMFALMNYFVHTVMYSYYAIRSMGINPSDYNIPINISLIVTALQILQMVAGLAIMVQVGLRCDTNICNPYNTIFGLCIYGTYFYLFMKYFINRYLFIKINQTNQTDT